MDYRNSWLWMHPLLTALATNPAFYYYYTAKAELLNQSTMVRRGSQRASKKTHSIATAQTTALAVANPVPALPFGTLGASGNTNDTLRQHGLKVCPQCQAVFNSTNFRPVQEACGHIKCRNCIIANDDGCPQCRDAERPRRGLPGAAIAGRRLQGSKQEDADLMPPLLTEEEPLASTSSSDRGHINVGQHHESPPVLSSATAISQPKLPLKRKQKELSPGAPSKIQKTSSISASPLGRTKADPRERPKGSRRSSTSSSKSSEQKSSSPKPSRLYRQDRSSSIRTAADDVSENGSKKRVGRPEARKSTTSSIPANQQTVPVTLGTQMVAQSKDKSTRLSSLRSGSSSGGSPQSPNRWSPLGRKRGGEASPTPQLLTKSKLSFGSQSKDDSGPSFAVTISPTTMKPGKSNSGPLITKPLLSPSKSTSRGSDDGGFSRTSLGSSIDVVMPGSSCSEGDDGSNSNSLETCDPLCIMNDGNDSNSAEGQSSKPEIKKKKKRSPVTIHDHITILSGEPPLYQCNVCMKKFKTKAHIKYHEFCQNGEKPYKCEQCGSGFIAKSHYEYHLRTHTGERPYVCPKCGKGFNQRGKVTRHMRSHTGEKPFICQQCGRGFANAQALRSHFLIHTGERPFACQYCNKRFTGMTNLKKHVITHTGERPFACNHCGKSFGLKWTLDLHLRTHSTERPFACDQCTRAFSNSKDLRRHLVIHSGERPFKCWICGTAFRRKDNLDRHIKNTHNQPKEVAKQLANEAAAEYLAQTKANQTNNTSKATTSKKAVGGSMKSTNADGPSTIPRNIQGKSDKNKPKKAIPENMDVIITADISPPASPHHGMARTETAVRDVYVLPNGQTDLSQGAIIQALEVTEAKTEVFVEVREFDGLAELRTVPVNEYHQIEGINLLETAKTKGEPNDPDVGENEPEEPNQAAVDEEKDEKPALDATNGLLFCGAPGTTDGGRNFNQGLTVTVVYENDGKTHFITDQPSQYPGAVDPLSFPTDQATGIMAVPRETLFSFEPTEHSSSAEKDLDEEDSSSQPRTTDIHLKKSETILSGNLSKFLQMDLPKTLSNNTHNENSEDDSSVIIASSGGVEENVDSDDDSPKICDIRSGDQVKVVFSSGPVVVETETRPRSPKCVKDEDNYEKECGNSPLSNVTDDDRVEKTLGGALDEDDGQTADNADIDPLKADSDGKESHFGSIHNNNNNTNELEEGEIESENLDGVAEKEGVIESETATGCSSPTKEVTDSSAQDNYPSDPMLQDPNADDDDKLQQQMDVSERLSGPSSDVVKGGEDSIIPEGMDSYDSPEAIFDDNIGRSRRNNEAPSIGRCIPDIVDKECPASILQDDTSNCDSVDPISDDDEGDFNEAFRGDEPLETGEIPKRRLRESIDPECPEQILEAENNEHSDADVAQETVKVAGGVGQTPTDILRLAVQHSHDNDTESISSTELEPMPDENDEDDDCTELKYGGSSAVDDKFSGTVDQECPKSILQDEEIDPKPGGAEGVQDSGAERSTFPSYSPRNLDDPEISGRSNSQDPLAESHKQQVSLCSFSKPDPSVSIGRGRSDGKNDGGSGNERDHETNQVLNPTVQLTGTETELTSGLGDNRKWAGEEEVDCVQEKDPLAREPLIPRPADFAESETEPISDTELEDSNDENDPLDPNSQKEKEKPEKEQERVPSQGMSEDTTDRVPKRKLEEENREPTERHVRAKVGDLPADEDMISNHAKAPDPDSPTAPNVVGCSKNSPKPEAVEDTKVGVVKNEEPAEVQSTNSTTSCVEAVREDTREAGSGNNNGDEEVTEDVPEGLTFSADELKECQNGEGSPYAVPCESPVETAEKSTQCVQTEDFSDFNEEEGFADSEGDFSSKRECIEDEAVVGSGNSELVRAAAASSSASSPLQAGAMVDQPSKAAESAPGVGAAGVDKQMNSAVADDEAEDNIPSDRMSTGEEVKNCGDGGGASGEDKSSMLQVTMEVSDHEESHLSPDMSSSVNTTRDMISPEPTIAYIAIPDSVGVPSQARLVYTNPLVATTGASSSVVAQPVNYSQSPSATSSYGTVVSSSSQPEMVMSNYSFVYAPEEPSASSGSNSSSMTPYPESQPSFRFVYDNGDPIVAENMEPVDNNMRIVYACAAATADPPGDSASGPQKVKLIYAEALGVASPDESGQVQLVYTSTTPNQNIAHAPNQNVRIYSPTLLTADTTANTKNLEMLFAQQPQIEPSSAPVPVEVLYNGNGTVMAQTVGQPQDLSWIRRDFNHSFTSQSPSTPAQSEKLCVPATTTSAYSSNTRIPANLASTREIANHHNYASNPYVGLESSKRVRFPGPYEGESDGLRTLARAAATRMITIQADADATTRAAAAIAAVGREAQIKRQMDIIERNRNIPGSQTVYVRKGESVPHRGPRKHYLSQLTNSRK